MKTNLTFNDLIEGEKLAFLVGAGCSVDAPSCLPAGRKMIEAMLKYSCAESEVNKILRLEDLRFERLVELIREHLDPQINLLNLYGLCDKPNLQHFFLADMINKGHFVMTTNFDFLIEYALLQMGIKKENITIVITKKDFQENSNPLELQKKGIKGLYKVHGSTENIITGENTRDSLIATMQGFGSNKEGMNVFQVEPFKQDLFNNIIENRTLILIGYSGSDDFDVVPTLKVLKNLNKIIWINYIHDDEGQEIINKIELPTKGMKIENSIDNILTNIRKMNNVEEIYKVNVNTTRLIQEWFKPPVNLDTEGFSIDPLDWLRKTLPMPNEAIKYFIPYIIYLELNVNEDAQRCGTLAYNNAKKLENFSLMSIILSNEASIYHLQGRVQEALQLEYEGLRLVENTEFKQRKIVHLINIGTTIMRGNPSKAFEMFTEALRICKDTNNLLMEAACYRGIGTCYSYEGNFEKVLENYEKALKIYEDQGNLRGMASCLENIGKIYHSYGNNQKALEYFNQALEIDDKLSDLLSKALDLNDIAGIYQEQKLFQEALKYYKQALEIDEKTDNLPRKVMNLVSIADIYLDQSEYQEALKLYKEALIIDEKINDLVGAAMDHEKIADVYYIQKQFNEARKDYELAQALFERVGMSNSPNANKVRKRLQDIRDV